MTSLPTLEGQRQPVETSHLNLRWTIADMERIAAMAAARNSAFHIATVMGSTSGEILDVCRRNGIAFGRL